MKKFIYILFLITCTTLSAQDRELSAQDRHVFWVHGLGDDADFWNRQYATAQRDYRISSSGFTYRTDEGVQRYADRIRTGSNSVRGTRTIAVGHSLGGVAIREANRDDSGLYGGMITLGAPLDGARLANEAISRGTDRFIEHSVETLRRGPIASQARTKWQRFRDAVNAVFRGRVASAVIRWFASGPILDVTKELTGGFQQNILDRFDPNDPTVRDLAENSPYFNSIRNFESSLPKILAWGDEDSPVHARLLASSLTLDINSNNRLLSAYNLAGIGYKIAADGIRVRGFLRSRRWKRRQRREKEAWNAGADYIKRGWEIAWNELIDARVLRTYTTTQRFYNCSGSAGPLQLAPVHHSEEYAELCGWEMRTVTRRRWVNTPSDGLIKRGSQVGDISKWKGKKVRLPGVNHLEMGVHTEVDKFFREAFNGRHGEFFRTDEK